MMKWKRAVIWLVISLLVGVAMLFVYWRYMYRGERNPVAVSLVRLISNPEEFNEKNIITQGMLRVSTGSYSARLYIHSDDSRYGLNYNSITIAIIKKVNDKDAERLYKDIKNYDYKYVSVSGIFRILRFPVERARMDIPVLYIENIRVCNLVREEKDCGPSIVLPEKSALNVLRRY